MSAGGSTSAKPGAAVGGGQRRLKVAVIGLGIGKSHLEAYAKLPDLFDVRAVCDIEPTRLATIAKEFGVARQYTSVDAMLAAESLDVFNICTPPFTHRALIEQCLAAGLNVICEKPLVGSLDDADAIAVAASRAKGQLFPIFQYRFGNGYRRLKHLQAKGFAHTAYLSTIETSWRREAQYYAVAWRGKWNTEMGGCCLTQAIHAHDMLCDVNGRIRSVFAHLATRVNNIEVEDCAAVSIAMENGSLATLSVTLGAVEQVSRLRFTFSDMTVESASPNPYRPGLEPWRFSGRTPEIDAKITEALADFVPLPEGFEGQFQAVHAAITAGAPSPVTLDDARQSLELITAIYHSGETGQPVTLPLSREHPRYRSWVPEDGSFARGTSWLS